MIETVLSTPPDPCSLELSGYLRTLGACDNMSLTALNNGCQSVTYLCQNGPFPGECVVQQPQDGLSGTALEEQYNRLRILDGRRAPMPLHLGRMAGKSVMCVEYIEGTHKDFNQLTRGETIALAEAVSEVHHFSSERFSCRSGQMPCGDGTYDSYIRAMVAESVTQRLWRQDLSLFPGSRSLFLAGGVALQGILEDKAELFSSNNFTALHHDLNPGNVRWRPDGTVVFLDWNLTFGDPADDLDYLFTNNRGSAAFRETFFSAYEPNPATGDVQARMPAYTLKNRLDDLAWTIEMCERFPNDPQWQDAYQERRGALDMTLTEMA